MNGTLFLQNREKILKKWKLEIGHIKNPIVGLVPEPKEDYLWKTRDRIKDKKVENQTVS